MFSFTRASCAREREERGREKKAKAEKEKKTTSNHVSVSNRFVSTMIAGAKKDSRLDLSSVADHWVNPTHARNARTRSLDETQAAACFVSMVDRGLLAVSCQWRHHKCSRICIIIINPCRLRTDER